MKNKNFLVLVRHGQSEWNAKNLFTGWKDPDLTNDGTKEAINAGSLIKQKDIQFSMMFTSALKRAQITGQIILNNIKQTDIKIEKNQALNERDYGDLSGLNKDDARKKWGEEQVHIWRRSFDIPPPNGESLKDTAERVIPFFSSEIVTKLKDQENVFISAHGNSLRSLIMHIENLSSEEILKREIATGKPLVYEFDSFKETYSLKYE